VYVLVLYSIKRTLSLKHDVAWKKYDLHSVFRSDQQERYWEPFTRIGPSVLMSSQLRMAKARLCWKSNELSVALSAAVVQMWTSKSTKQVHLRRLDALPRVGQDS